VAQRCVTERHKASARCPSDLKTGYRADLFHDLSVADEMSVAKSLE